MYVYGCSEKMSYVNMYIYIYVNITDSSRYICSRYTRCHTNGFWSNVSNARFIWYEYVSLTFHEFSKIFSRNLCTAEMVLLMRISSWNSVRVAKAWLWIHATRTQFQLEIIIINVIYVTVYFREIILSARETLAKQAPGVPWSSAAMVLS